MPDQLYLSFWIRGFTGHNMLRHFEKLLSAFPFSTQAPGIRDMRIYALEYAEPPLYERSFGPEESADAGEALLQAAEFSHADCAYLLTGCWDLWRFDGLWKLTPCPVTLACFGPLFQQDLGDQLRIEFGSESDFLPRPELAGSIRKIQSNVRGLLRLTHELDDILAAEKRQLWSESGENFVDKLQSALEEP